MFRTLVYIIVIVILGVFNYNDLSAGTSLEEKKIKADSLYSLSIKFLSSNVDSALYFAKQHKSISYEINDFEEKVLACFLVGRSYSKLKYFDQAAYNYFEGLAILKEPNELFYKKLKISLLKNLGDVYNKTYSYELALQYTLQALELAKSVESDEKIASLFYNTGVIYENKLNYKAAIQYYNKAIDIASEISDEYSMAKSYTSLGNIYFAQHKYDSAKNFYLKALDRSKGVSSLQSSKAIYLGNIGECYYNQSEFKKAKQYYFDALAISKEFNDTRRIKWLNYNLGNLNQAEGNLQEAITYYQNCIELGDDKAIDEYYKKASKQLSSTYQQIGDLDNALSYIKKYNTQLEKIEETKENLTQQNAQYRMKEVEWELEKKAKEAKIAKIETENIWVKILVTIALIVIFVGSRYTYIYHKKIARIKEVIYMDDVDPDEYA